jgi:methyltransferase (TIGR00027 family)
MATPSRTSILVAAARAFGSRDPDAGVRNPDHLADTLIGPEEIALITDHPVSKGLSQDYAVASQDPHVAILTSLMIFRTRFIDAALERAVKNGASQIVLLGAGFDSRAHRFSDLLSHCRVIEVDAAPTQQYKQHRVAATIGAPPQNHTYLTVDFSKDNLADSLQAAGFLPGEKSFFIWEGVSMYLSEENIRKTLQIVASLSAPGSSLVLDYVNSHGINMSRLTPNGPGTIPAQWGEPWIFGVPGTNGDEFFRELGFHPGTPLSLTSPEAMRQYAVRKDGTTYAQRIFEKMRADFTARMKDPAAQPLPAGLLEVQKAIATAGGFYWLTELTVSRNPPTTGA